MKIRITPYQLGVFRKLNKTIFASLFLVLLFANPIVQITGVFENNKFELVDSSEKEEPAEQENVSELENEIKFLQSIDIFSFQKDIKKQSVYFIIQSSFLNYKQDIQLPPPRIV